MDLEFCPEWSQANNGHSGRYLSRWQGRSCPAAANKRVNHADFDAWARDRIAKTFVNSGVTYTTLDPLQTPASSGAHTDTERQAALIYNLVPGGPDVNTVFWQEHGQDIVRPNRTWVLDDQKLVQIHSLLIRPRIWTLINATVLHSAENLMSTRIALQIGFMHQDLDQLGL